MKRTQVQLPETLYAEVKRLAEEQEWSVAEVLRRGAEYMVSCYPVREEDWAPPGSQAVGPFLLEPEQWRDLADSSDARL